MSWLVWSSLRRPWAYVIRVAGYMGLGPHRLASEFQGFARELHDEAGVFVVRHLAPGNPQLQDVLHLPYAVNRKLNQGNADPALSGTTSA
jgi:hypothetical protein